MSKTSKRTRKQKKVVTPEVDLKENTLVPDCADEKAEQDSIDEASQEIVSKDLNDGFDEPPCEEKSDDSLINQIEALIFSSSIPLPLDKIVKALEQSQPTLGEARDCLEQLQQHYKDRGVHLVEVASGWRFQVALSCAPTIVRTLVEKPGRLSRALLETLALIAYRQPITRAEIESIRGVVVSTQMVKTLLDHEWIRVVGHKDVPGKPALYATTKTFLDDIGLKKLDELPPLAEIKSLIAQEIEQTQARSIQEIAEDIAQTEIALEDEIEQPIPEEQADEVENLTEIDVVVDDDEKQFS